MENKVKDFSEFGDCMAVFAGKYLGYGKAIIKLNPLWHDIRRDSFMPTGGRKLQKLGAGVVLELRSGNRVWCAWEELAENIFTGGGVLQLFPRDLRSRGYQFERCFFAGLEHASGSGFAYGNIKLVFDCETSAGSNSFFTRLPEGSVAEDLPEMVNSGFDLKGLLRQVGVLLAEKLDAVFDHSLCIDFFAPDPRGSCSLELENCREWNVGACTVFDLRLTARYPVSEKFFIDQKIYNAAQFLHGYILETQDNATLLCQIKDLDFSKSQSVAGKNFTNSVMRFSLTVL